MRESTRKMPGPRERNLILTPAFNTCRKNPSVWTQCLGNSKKHHIFSNKNILSVFQHSLCVVRAVKGVISLVMRVSFSFVRPYLRRLLLQTDILNFTSYTQTISMGLKTDMPMTLVQWLNGFNLIETGS